MWSRILFTHQTIKIILLLLANSQEMLRRTCRLSPSGCDLETVLPLGASHVWGASLGLTSPTEKPSSCLQLLAHVSPPFTSPKPCLSAFPFPWCFLLGFLHKAKSQSHSLPIPGRKPQILLSSSSRSSVYYKCIISEEFLFSNSLAFFF